MGRWIPDRKELLAALVAERKKSGAKASKTGSKKRTIVFTNGVFDLLHAGHAHSLQRAAAFGDVLVVGVNDDASVKRLKGDKRPIVPIAQRGELLAALASVAYATPFSEDTPEALIRAVEPDVLVKGKDYEGKEVVGADFVRARGGKVELIELVPGVSTSDLVQEILRRYR